MAEQHVKVRRPPEDASPAEVKDYLRSLGRALEAIGVGYGEQFAVVPASAFDQAALDEGGLGPFAKDSETSRKAAIDTYPKAGGHRWRILAALQAFPDGLTRDELEVCISTLKGNTIRPRVQELIQGGFAVEVEETRTTRQGSEAKVVKITEQGVEALRKSIGTDPQYDTLEDALAATIHAMKEGADV